MGSINSMISRIGKNDPTFTKLHINTRSNPFDDDEDETYTGNNYLKLSESISKNTQIKALSINLFCNVSDMVDGLRLNGSIKELRLQYYHHSSHRMVHSGIICQILEVYEKKNTLTSLCIQDAPLYIWPISQVINTTLRRCTHLKQVELIECNMTDEELLSIVEAIKGHPTLEKLYLYANSIGNVGCEALATLLEDSNCNIHTLNLINNRIGTIGATYLAGGLVNNTKLKHLDLANSNDHIDPSTMDTVFGSVLCKMESPTATYHSNHTLERLYFNDKSGYLWNLSNMNNCSNKNDVAIRKILKYHPDIDMEPLFELDSEGEWSLKSLPYIVCWFERAEAVIEEDERSMSSDDSSVSSNEEEYRYDIDRRRLSAMYDFAKAMPLLFVPPSHSKAVDRKRKREGIRLNAELSRRASSKRA